MVSRFQYKWVWLIQILWRHPAKHRQNHLVATPSFITTLSLQSTPCTLISAISLSWYFIKYTFWLRIDDSHCFFCSQCHICQALEQIHLLIWSIQPHLSLNPCWKSTINLVVHFQIHDLSPLNKSLHGLVDYKRAANKSQILTFLPVSFFMNFSQMNWFHVFRNVSSI